MKSGKKLLGLLLALTMMVPSTAVFAEDVTPNYSYIGSQVDADGADESKGLEVVWKDAESGIDEFQKDPAQEKEVADEKEKDEIDDDEEDEEKEKEKEKDSLSDVEEEESESIKPDPSDPVNATEERAVEEGVEMAMFADEMDSAKDEFGSLIIPPDALVYNPVSGDDTSVNIVGLSATWFQEQFDTTITATTPVMLSLSIPAQNPGGKNIVGFESSAFQRDKSASAGCIKNSNYRLTSVDMSEATNLKSIGYQLVSGGKGTTAQTFFRQDYLIKVVMNDATTQIGMNSFRECTKLTTVRLSKGLKDIGEGAFSGCGSLTKVNHYNANAVDLDKKIDGIFVLPEGLLSIGMSAFLKCFADSVDASVVIPASVTTIANQAFHNSPAIKSITVLRKNTDDGGYAHYNQGAFKNSVVGVGNRITVFPDYGSFSAFTTQGQNYITYPVTVYYDGLKNDDSTDYSQQKLYKLPLSYTKKDSNIWAIDSGYTLPELPTDPQWMPEGYTGGWVGNNTSLTPDTKFPFIPLASEKNLAHITISLAPALPTISPTVNGEIVEEVSGVTRKYYVEVPKGGADNTVGIVAEHPLTETGNVMFRYRWTDLDCNDETGGRSLELDGTSMQHPYIDKLDMQNLPIRNSSDYTQEGTSTEYYFVLITGYYKPDGSDAWTVFYRSNTPIIEKRWDPTDKTIYSFEVGEYDPAIYITFDLDGGNVGGDPNPVVWSDVKSATLGEYSENGNTVSIPTPVKDRYTLVGWKDDEGITFTLSEMEQKAVTESTTYTAKWVENYTLTFNPVDGINAPASINESPGTDIDITTLKPECAEDKKFIGWFTDKVDGTLITNFSELTEDTTLYAQYSDVIKFAVTFDAGSNGAFADGAITSVNVLDGKPIGSNVPSVNADSKYKFTGWQVTVNGEVKTMTQAEVEQLIPTEDTTITAVYKRKNTDSGSSGGGGGGSTPKYDIEFDTNGGLALDDVSVSKGKEVDLDKYTPEKEGHEFDGWYLDKDFTEEVTSITVKEDVVLYAKWIEAETPDILNNVDHFAYMYGDEKGLFNPNNSITRAEVAQMFYNLLNDKGYTGAPSFNDVSSEAWYYVAVTALSSKGVLSGYDDGSFKPNASVTRAEFVAIVSRFYDLEEGQVVPFDDVPENHWAYEPIMSALSVGWLKESNAGSFRPEESMTRAETAQITNAALGRVADQAFVDNNPTINRFPDVSANYWAYYDIVETTVGHDYTMTNKHEDWTEIK